ncbi:MAG: CRISPR system precrRNA processing endoribonuclease RAMP protein Cas6 [Peptococcaceae bacterium]|nr:MAG: CRISPR system precrRNA processing endoribonuclease RAMP protein Cas6 [Peptococcaceae bacterium]
MNCPGDFSCAKYEILLTAGPSGLLLPPYKGSTLRGGFASAFQRLVCVKKNYACPNCLLKENCPYHLVFETSPPPGSQVLRNLSSIPRPFILEPPLERRTEYRPGEEVCFKLLLFGRVQNLLPYFIITLEELGRLGMGKGRRPFAVKEIAAEGFDGDQREVVYRGEEKLVRAKELVITAAEIWREETDNHNGEKVVLRFLTPTRLFFQSTITSRPHFHILVRNLLRRISSLCYFFHGYTWEEDFVGIIKRAEEVRLVKDNTTWFNWERYSSRHERKIELGGLVGEAVYEGPIGEFRPLLRLGELIHAGKGVVFGLGLYEIGETGRPVPPEGFSWDQS